jgi:hypothetical protein
MTRELLAEALERRERSKSDVRFVTVCLPYFMSDVSSLTLIYVVARSLRLPKMQLQEHTVRSKAIATLEARLRPARARQRPSRKGTTGTTVSCARNTGGIVAVDKLCPEASSAAFVEVL